MNHPTRRRFLRTSLLGGALSWTIPAFLDRTFLSLDTLAAASPVQTATGKDSTILVVLQLAGGNDGLNTLVPHSDDDYHRARPTIAIPADSTLHLTPDLGLHPSLAHLKALHDDGHLATIQGVGYPNPNRSHFRSTEIWHTASEAPPTTGWLGRYFDATCNGSDPSAGIGIGAAMPLALSGRTPSALAFENPRNFESHTSEEADSFLRDSNDPDAGGASIDMLAGAPLPTADPLDFLKRTAHGALESSDRVLEIARRRRHTPPYPATRLANSLRTIANLIAGDMPTRVYYLAQGGYDTHSRQANTHERLLKELDQAVAAFTADLKSQRNFDRVALMTFSEFGRRVAENASGGTDHGAAAPLFIAGGAVRPGLHGTTPSLSRLHRGDLVHTTDFRSVYATLLANWLDTNPNPILGGHHPLLGFV